LARADSSQPLSIGDVDLAALVVDVAAQASRTHPQRRFHTQTPPARVRGDEDGLRRLLRILTDNAVAHTADGGQIWITLEVTAGTVSLKVADDGHGIPSDMHERIFGRFVRAHPTSHPEGNGLGLAIARSLAQAHQGRIWAGTNGSGGATFTVDLPAAGSSDS
jgi:two-component system OmpR family sensor kinase